MKMKNKLDKMKIADQLEEAGFIVQPNPKDPSNNQYSGIVGVRREPLKIKSDHK